MIGIDMTRISRFQEMKKLEKFCEKYNVVNVDALEAAKTWACLESITKAEGRGYDFTKVHIRFPFDSPPLVVDNENILPNKYFLTLSHEGDLVVAVALVVQGGNK